VIVGYVKGAGIPQLGAFHGSDIAYFFGFSNATDWVATDAVSKFYYLLAHSKGRVSTNISLFHSPS
jgi:hypothetical protein